MLYLLSFIDPDCVYQKVIWYFAKNLLKTYVENNVISNEEAMDILQLTPEQLGAFMKG